MSRDGKFQRLTSLTKLGQDPVRGHRAATGGELGEVGRADANAVSKRAQRQVRPLQVFYQGAAKLASPSLLVLWAEVLREQAKTSRNWLRQAGFRILEVLQHALDPGKPAAVLLSGADNQLAVQLPGDFEVPFGV